jgi:hypothetical protein
MQSADFKLGIVFRPSKTDLCLPQPLLRFETPVSLFFFFSVQPIQTSFPFVILSLSANDDDNCLFCFLSMKNDFFFRECDFAKLASHHHHHHACVR